MKKIQSIFVILFILLVGCGKEEGFSGEFTITGTVVVAPDNTPIKGVVVSITNGATTIGNATTGGDGKFSITINKGEVNASYYLLLTDNTKGITKKIDLFGFGQSYFDYGNIELYEALTISGTVLSSPSNTPLNGIIAKITDGTTTLVSTTTNETGFFSMSFDKSEINKSFYLSLSDAIYGVSNNYAIEDIGKSYNYGNIFLYDSRNPYNLPTFTYSNYTYTVHPIMREKYSYEEAISVCAGLNEMGSSDWFIPNEPELSTFFMALDLYGRREYPSGDYTTSTEGHYLGWSDVTGISYRYNYTNGYKAYLLPMTRYK